MNFNPIFTFKDAPDSPMEQTSSYTKEQRKIIIPSNIDSQLKNERYKVLESDYLIFIAPTWWMSFPAILKGWMDRVLLMGALPPHNVYKNGTLRGKKCMIITSAGFDQQYFSKKGPQASGVTIEENYWHIIDGTFAYCGMETLPMMVCYRMDSSTEMQRKAFMDELGSTLDNIENLKPITCPLLHSSQ